MLELTVISVALTFRPTNPNANPPEVWSADNDVTPDPETGEPQLGRVKPTNPFGTIGFFTNIEIVGSITPCVPGLASDWKFVQRKQGWAVNQNTDGSYITDFLVSCPPGAGGASWCSDDPGFESQDTALDVDESCVLFMIDRPGIPTGGGQCRDGVSPGTRALCMRFRTGLTADGFRANTGSVEWRSTTEVSCDFGTWGQTNTVYGNTLSLGAGVECLNPDPLASPLNDEGRPVEGDAFSVDALLSDLNNVNGSIRSRAARGVIDRIRKGELPPAVVSLLAMRLIRLASIHRDQYEFLSKTELAIRILGELRAIKAIPTMIQQIDKNFFPRFAIRREDIYVPAAVSLAQIGAPALGPILNQCRRAPDADWQQFLYVLRTIDRDTPLVRQTVRTVLDAQAWFEEVEAAGGAPQPSDAERARRTRVKNRLLDFLSTPEPERPRPVISALPRPLERVTAVAR